MSAEQLCGLTKERGKPDGTPTVSTHLLQIQTILSVLELHQISMNMLADFTADREFHPALKTFISIQFSFFIISWFFANVNIFIL